MAFINDLLRQVTDSALRERLANEINRLSKNKKFGLVFEEHIPECTPLYGVPVRRNQTVARKAGKMNDIYTVKKIDGESAVCLEKSTQCTEIIPIRELVSVAQFGEPIFPSLEPIAKVTNAPDDSLWHTIIEADNYHALQLLEYLNERKVDCIYIDPPYNTGAKDWKYNNDYVDSNDVWRHSKWLSMMKKRLLLAKRVLNPNTGVLIVTIDEHEYDHLSILLSDLFPETRIQMVSTMINPANIARAGEFGRCDEYLFFVMFGKSAPQRLRLNREWVSSKGRTHTGFVRWDLLRRSGLGSSRRDSPGCFYPIYIDPKTNTIVSIGDALPEGQSTPSEIEGLIPVLPIKKNGSEGRWQWTTATFRERQLQGRVKAGGDEKRGYAIYILKDGEYEKIKQGEFHAVGKAEDGSLLTEGSEDSNYVMAIPGSQWKISTHDSTQYGSRLLNDIMPDRYFPFPKSLYAVKDAINFFVCDNPNALILDFFAGSGTTLHAVNLLNAEDGGKRRCILVTNNEVSEAEARDLKALGYHPGDPEWEKYGICRSVTWPRTTYSILGKRANGTVLSGEYYTNQTTTKETNRSFYQLSFVENPANLTLSAKKQIVALIGKDKLPQSLVKADSLFIVSEKHKVAVLFDIGTTGEWLNALEEQEHITDFYIVVKEHRAFNDIKQKVADLLGPTSIVEPVKRLMSEGFSANVEYFKLGFLDRNTVSLGQQFHAIWPLLWLKAGAIGERPELAGKKLPDMLIQPQNSFAVLLNENLYGSFAEALLKAENIGTVYFVTNSEEAFREMSEGIGIERTYQLYRDYIDNFVIGSRRNHI